MSRNYYYYSTRSYEYQRDCLLRPVQSSAVGAVLFAGLDVVTQGTPWRYALSPSSLGRYFGVLYLYNAVQCPMEAASGRPSLWHNIVSAGALGYVGVRTGRVGVPFVNTYQIRYQLGWSPEVVAFAVYGGMAGILAGLLGGKPF
jgi:hypothetical protein